VGTDRPQKRGQLLPSILEALPEVDLDLVGRFSQDFLRRFRALGDRVQARGVLSGDALATAYASADLLLHPAAQEAFGLVPFEAALFGTAAVVAGGHGCGEWYGKAGGCVVAPDDVAALVGALRGRLEDPDLARREAGRVQAFTRRNLTWEAAAQGVEALYEDVLGGRR